MPISILGDSHGFAFSDRVYEAGPRELYVFRALYLPQLPTRAFASAEGKPHPLIVRALESVRILVPGPKGPEAGHRSEQPIWKWAAEIDGRTTEPIVVFSTGSLDLIDVGTAIAKEDFALPAFVTSDLATPEDCRRVQPGAVAADRVEELLETSVAPLRTVVRYLRGLGITKLGVLGIGPVTPDRATYKRMLDAFGIPIPNGHLEPSFRRKLVVGMNAILRRLCDQEGAVFVDRWARSTHEGEPLPLTRVDGVHYTPEAASATAADIIAAFGGGAGSGGGARGYTDAAEPRDSAEPRIAYVRAGERALDDPHLAATYRLAAPARGMRVLEIGGGEQTLAPVFRDEGLDVATLADPEAFIVLRNGRGANEGERYDLIVAYDAPDRLTTAALEHVYARAASALAPGGALIVRASWNPERIRAQARPSTLTRQLHEAFPHLAVWLTTAGDPLGSLTRDPAQADLDRAERVLAYASHRPFDLAELAERLRGPAPLPESANAAVLRDASAPAIVTAGTAFEVEVVLENPGDAELASWGPTPVRFAYFWTDPRGELRNDHARAPLLLPAPPRSERRYGLRLTAPAERGHHGLRIALIQQHVRWFGAGVDVRMHVE